MISAVLDQRLTGVDILSPQLVLRKTLWWDVQNFVRILRQTPTEIAKLTAPPRESVSAGTSSVENSDKDCGKTVERMPHVSHAASHFRQDLPRAARQSSHTRSPNGSRGR